MAPYNGFEPSLLGFQSNVLPLNTITGYGRPSGIYTNRVWQRLLSLVTLIAPVKRELPL